MDALGALIANEIATTGPMPFDRFMAHALYHAEHGYYAQPHQKIGRAGDFFTSVSVGPLFGRLLARQFLQMWDLLEWPSPFWIIEQGAHEARLAVDILQWSAKVSPDFFKAARYGIVEPGDAPRSLQKLVIEQADLTEKVEWFRTFDDFAPPRPWGVFFSNELVDAFPVRVIRFHEKEWVERRVALDPDGNFIWMDCALVDVALREAIARLPLPEIEGYTTELSLDAQTWIKDVSRILERGYVLTIDYGFPASAYYAVHRINGTLTSYANHRQMADVLHQPGTQDITAHVDFTTLARAGMKAGLSTLGFLDQQRFLMGVAHDEFSGDVAVSTGIAENIRAWNTLTHPEHLGSRFQVLVQGKDAPAPLCGLRFAREGGLD